MKDGVSVTLLTGFLGAGKTTLLNYFLRNHPSPSVVIVENEFGAANIDGELLERGENINVIEVSNGCVCCNVRGEFTEAMVELLARRSSGALPFDTLVVEATGLADPGPVIQTFFTDERLRDTMRLDAVITLADCRHITRQLDEHPVAAAQLAFADRILITKTDTCDETQKNNALSRILRINNKAQILDVRNGECSPHLWLDIGAFDMDGQITLNEGYHIITARPESNGRFRPVISQSPAPEQDVIQAHVLEAGVLDLKKVGEFMERCVAQYGNDMLRYKGVLAISGNPQRLVVQGVHKVVGFDYGAEWLEKEPVRSRLVIIGRYLPVDELRQGFLQTAV